MKSLTHICVDADKDLSFLGIEQGELEKEVKNWIDEDFTIIAHRASVKNQNVMLVVEELDKSRLNGLYKYSVLRFFVVGGKWRTSVDKQYKDKEEVFQYLLDRFE